MADETQDMMVRQREHQPHKGSYGLCAPNSIAGDQRAMVSRPYATIAHSMRQARGAYQVYIAADPVATPPVKGQAANLIPEFRPMRDNTSTGSQAAYLVGTAGIGEVGTDCGIADLLTRHETSFFSEGYPFRDYEFVLRGLSIVPEGKPFRAASPSTVSGTVQTAISIGGDKASPSTLRPTIVDGLCSELADSVVAAFFQSVSLQLGFKSESAKWDIATPMFHPGGLGLVGSATPTNASPIGGKTLTLPFEVQLPRANNRGVSVAQLMFRQEQPVGIFGSTTGAKDDFAAGYFNDDSSTDSLALVQLFKVILIGERQCAAMESDALVLARLAQQFGCSVEQAKGMRDALQATNK